MGQNSLLVPPPPPPRLGGAGLPILPPKPPAGYTSFLNYSTADKALKVELGLKRPCIEIPELNIARLESFNKSVKTSVESPESHRLKIKGRTLPVLDYRNLDKDIELIVVGDLHGNLDNLEAILKDKDNWKKIVEGKAKLLFLGDFVHPESFPLGDMKDSIVMMNWVMQLKMLCPNGVEWIVGNHDPLHETTYKGPEEFPYAQSEIYRDELEKSYKIVGPSSSSDPQLYLKKYSESFMQIGGSMMARSERHVFAHAEPPAGKFRKTSDFSILKPIYDEPDLREKRKCDNDIRRQHKSRWARFDPNAKDEKSLKVYGPKTVWKWRRFETKGRKLNTLVHGHNPQRNNGIRDQSRSHWWLGKGKSKHLILVSNHKTPTYASIVSDKMKICGVRQK